MTDWIMIILFWLSAGTLLYTFIGYPLLLGGLARYCPRPWRSAPPDEWPSVTVVIAVHNEEPYIRDRILNLFNSHYPSDRLTVMAVSDGSTDPTVSILRELQAKHAHLIVLEQARRSGKAACLNTALEHVQDDLIVLTDARQRFDPHTVETLVAAFAEPSVGAVSGALCIAPSRQPVGAGLDAYWQFEKWLRLQESRVDSCLGCTGAVYAIRRALYRPIPEDTLIDDVVIPMTIAAQGYRVVFETQATAHDPVPLDPDKEFRRKRRTLAGNYQMLFRHPAWACPGGHRLWWCLVSHKYLRLAAPFFLIGLAGASMLLADALAYRICLILQAAFYSLAVLGTVLPPPRPRLLSWASGFVFLNGMGLLGFWDYLARTYREGWRHE